MKKGVNAVKTRKYPVICLALLACVFALSCHNDSHQSDAKSFDSKLRGKWEANTVSEYSGTLTIDYDTITISGYLVKKTTSAGSSTPPPGTDERLLSDIPRDKLIKGYSQDGKIFIDFGSGLNGIPYKYTETAGTYPYNKVLALTISGSEEILDYKGN
jgi:hypothetical protein